MKILSTSDVESFLVVNHDGPSKTYFLIVPGHDSDSLSGINCSSFQPLVDYDVSLLPSVLDPERMLPLRILVSLALLVSFIPHQKGLQNALNDHYFQNHKPIFLCIQHLWLHVHRNAFVDKRNKELISNVNGDHPTRSITVIV